MSVKKKPRIGDLKPAKPLPATIPLPPSLAVASALQALHGGTATPMQQKFALKWIIDTAAGLNDWPYRDNQRESDIMLGRQFVAHQIVAALKINLAALEGSNHAER